MMEVSASQDGKAGGAFRAGLGAAVSDVCSCCPETTLEISWNSRSRASLCSGEGGYCVSVHKVPRMGRRGERHTKSVVKRNESRQLATAECRLCRAAFFYWHPDWREVYALKQAKLEMEHWPKPCKQATVPGTGKGEHPP